MTNNIDLGQLADQRLWLLDQGYEPLPNQDKRLFIKKWTTRDITPEFLEEFRGSIAHQGIGLRMTNTHLMAFDVDVDDPEIVEEMWYKALSIAPELENCLVRHSGGNKEMWILRCNEQFKFLSTPKFVPPDADPEAEEPGEIAQVEVFGGTSNKQIGVYGAHTINKLAARPPHKVYEYEGRSIVETPYEDLPVITHEHVRQISREFSLMLQMLGWHRVKRFRGADHEVRFLYDLKVDGEFWPNNDAPVSYAELGSYSSCRMREITDQGTNCSRGVIYTYSSHGNAVGVWDSETHISHLPPSAKPVDVGDIVNRMNEALAARPELAAARDGYIAQQAARDAAEAEVAAHRATPEGIRQEAMADWVPDQFENETLFLRLLDEYVIYPEGLPGERVRSIHGAALSKDGFTDMFCQTVEIDQGVYQRSGDGYEMGDPKPPKLKRIAELWLASEGLYGVSDANTPDCASPATQKDDHSALQTPPVIK
jgi:hypothetical protein